MGATAIDARQDSWMMRGTRRHTGRWAWALAVWAALLLPCGANALTPAAFNTMGEQFILTPHLGWFMEPGGPMTLQEVQARFAQGDYAQGSEEWLELGMMQGTMWLGMTVRNETQENDLVLEFRNPRMSFVDLYVPNGAGGYTVLRNGNARPFDVREIRHPMPAFPLKLAQGEEATIYLRLENIGDFRMRVWLWDSAAFFNHMSSAYYPEMVMIGVLLVLALFHLLVFLSLRERAYCYLSLFITNWLLFFMAANGTGVMLVWRDLPWLGLRANSVFLILMCASFLLFTLSYLESHKYTPKMYRVGQVTVLLWLAHLVYSITTDTLLRIYLNQALSMLTLVVLALLVLQAMRKGSRMAYFFLVTWIFLLSGAGLMLMLSWYLLSSHVIIGSSFVNVLFILSILLWSFELTGRVKVRAVEQRKLLEDQVRARTRELETTLSEVKTLSGLLPICSSCKKIRDDSGYWNSVEHYLVAHTDANFTHGICPDCCVRLYPEFNPPHYHGPEPAKPLPEPPN
jgi:hypothetical protein